MGTDREFYGHWAPIDHPCLQGYGYEAFLGGSARLTGSGTLSLADDLSKGLHLDERVLPSTPSLMFTFLKPRLGQTLGAQMVRFGFRIRALSRDLSVVPHGPWSDWEYWPEPRPTHTPAATTTSTLTYTPPHNTPVAASVDTPDNTPTALPARGIFPCNHPAAPLKVFPAPEDSDHFDFYAIISATEGRFLFSVPGTDSLKLQDHGEAAELILMQTRHPGSGKPITVRYLTGREVILVNTYYADVPPHDFDKPFVFELVSGRCPRYLEW